MSYSLMTVETLGWMLIHSVWIIAAVAVLDSFIKLLLRRRSANARYLAGCAALLLSAASLPISLVFLVEQVAVIQHEDATALRGSISVSRSKEITAPDGTEMSISWDEQLTLPIKELDQHLTSQTAPTSTPSVDPPFVERLRELVQPHLSKIVTGWFIGIVLLSIRPLLGWRHARRLRSTGIVDVSEDVQRLFAALMHRISMTRAVQLVESQLVQIPSVVGAFKPVILLPATAMTGLTPDQLQAVLAHELAHIRRHDYLINGLQTAIETLLFYHPAIWWMSRRVRIERENCCDDFVVTLLDNSAEYCRALVTIDRLRQGSPLPVLAMHATDGSLLARVRRLAGVESPSRFSNSPAIVLMAFVVVGTTLAWSLSYAQNEEAPPLPEDAVTIEEATSSSPGEEHAQEVPPDPLPSSPTEKSAAKLRADDIQQLSVHINDGVATISTTKNFEATLIQSIIAGLQETGIEKFALKADQFAKKPDDAKMWLGIRIDGESAELSPSKEFPADSIKAVIESLSKGGVKKVSFAVADGEDKKPAATDQKVAARPDTPTGRLLTELAEQNASNDIFEDVWCKTIMQIVELGPEALPELIAELDATDDDMMLSCLGFMLRAIDDKRAVPALIRAIPKTLRPPRSDAGLLAEDEAIAEFMQRHDLSDRDGPLQYSFGRSIREIFGALHKLTGQSFDEITLYHVFLHGTKRQRYMKQRFFARTARKWAGWWEQNWKEHVQDEAYSKVDLPQVEQVKMPEPIDANRRLNPNQHLKTLGTHSGGILESFKTPKRNQQVFYDFDTGRYAGLPDKWKNMEDVNTHLEEIVAWANEEGYDMMGDDFIDPASGQAYYALRPIELQTWELSEEYWKFTPNNITIEELQSKGTPAADWLLHYDAEKKIYDPAATATFLFKTREGTPGLVFVGVEVKDDGLKRGMPNPGDDELSPIAFDKGRRFGWTQFEELPVAEKNDAEPKPREQSSETTVPATIKPPAGRAAEFQPPMPRISVVDADSPYDEAAEVNSLGVPYEPDVKQVTRPVQDFALLKLPERVAGEVVDNVTGKRVEGATVTFRFYLGSDTDRANADATFTFRDVGQFEFDIPEKFRPNANNEGSAPPLIRCTVERIVEHPDYQPLERSTMSFGRLAQITMADYVSRWFQRIELTPGVEVTGQVLDFDRRPAKGIRVFSGRNRAGWQNGCVHETFTDADGRYRLIVPKKHGPGRIYVIPDHASAVSRAITPEFGEQEVFQLRRGTRLHGKVVDVDGKGVPRIVVRTNGGERIPWRYAVTDSKGEYTMPPLQYGTYDIELIDQGQIPDSMHIGSRLPFVYVNRKLTLSKDAPVERRLDFPPVEKVTVTARCTNSDGSPVTGSTFSIYGTANTTHWRGTLTDVPGEPGTYSVRVPKGIQQLRVEHVGGRYFYRITRHSQNGAEPLGNWFVQVDEDDDSLRIERWNAATIRVRTLVDGKRFDVVSGHGGLHWPRFADVEHARKLGGEAATSIMLNSPDDRGFWQTDVHPEIDIVLKIDAPGFAPWSKTVRLDEGEIREIDVPLERIVDRSVERRVTP